MQGLQYTLGSCGKGVANTLSGFTRAMASCKLLFYATVKIIQALEKLINEAVAKQLKMDTKKIRYWFQQKECLVENKK